MGYKTLRLATKKIDLGDGYFVVIQPLNKAASDECNAALFGSQTFEGQLSNLDDIRAKLDHSAFSDMQMAKSIVDWNIDLDDEGVVSPITLENVRRLNQADSNKIVAEIRELSGLGASRSS